MPDDFPDLDALKAKDNAAWDVAFSHLWPIARNAAKASFFGLTDCEIEDAAGEAMIALISQIEKVQNVSHLKARLALIARNRAISAARGKSAVKRLPPADEQWGSAELHESTSTVLWELEQEEMLQLLAKALATLDPQTRLILVEKGIHGLTSQEVSQKYGIPLGTVCTKTARGICKVRESLVKSPALMKELQAYLR